MNKLSLLFFAMMALVALSACNTMRGVGQDIERGGAAIEKAATK